MRIGSNPNAKATIEALSTLKTARFPDDERLIVECTMTPEGVVKVQWTDLKEAQAERPGLQ